MGIRFRKIIHSKNNLNSNIQILLTLNNGSLSLARLELVDPDPLASF